MPNNQIKSLTVDGVTYDIVDETSGYMKGMTILSYGISTWQDFLDAYTEQKVVYCKASSNSNPASGEQNRLAFMAYVNHAENPTEVEFQYYRSVSTHSITQQGDQVFIYKLTSAGTWTVTTRETMAQVRAGGDLTETYSNNVLTISGDIPDVSGLAPLNSPALTGTPTAPTPTSGDDSTQIATTAFVQDAMSGAGLGTITAVKTTAGAHTTINVTSGAAQFNVPTKTSHLTNDSGYITGYTETDPIYSASAASGITSSDISNWNSKTSNVGTVTSVGVSNATDGGLSVSGSPVTASGTISVGHSNILTSAQTTQAVYPIKIDKNGHISAYGSAVTIPSITLNGSSTTSPSFYAPTTTGTWGQILVSSGNGAPTWSTTEYLPLSGGTVTGDTTFDGTVTLNSTPTNNTDAATKKYVDDSVKSFGSLSSSISASTLASGYTPTSDGMLIVTGVAASGKTNYIYIHTNAGTSSSSYYVYGATSASGGRLGTTIPVHANWTYTMVYTTTSSAWSTAVTGRFVPFN